MPPELCQMIYDVPILERLFPSSEDLTFADVSQHLVSTLDSLQLMPQNIIVWGDKIG